jgi:aminoglycoside phosphotransferase (APT) family kinase protein
MNSDPRCAPLIMLDFEQIKDLLSSVTNNGAVEHIELVEGGLVNTIYRIKLVSGESLCLRIFATGSQAWEIEHRILSQVSSILPVPNVVGASDGGSHFAYPYLIYRWIDGITLNSCRKLMSPTDFLSLAEPLGRALASIAGFRLTGLQRTSDKVIEIRTYSIEQLLEDRLAMLRRGLVRSRLGETLADALLRVMEAEATRLCALDRTAGLVHGDLGGRNILVAPLHDGGWRISGLIDWENAFSGSVFWDIGSLFRYSRRYTEAFRQRFAQSYRDGGATLPEDWWQSSRLLDAIRSIEIFDGDVDLPILFEECRGLLGALSEERQRSADC